MQGISTSNLLKLPLFGGLTAEELSKLNRHLRLKTVSAGGSITLAGQSIQEIYIILKGVVHIQLDQANGTPVILAILEPGELVDITSPVGKKVYLTSAVAKEDTTLLWIDYAVFQEYLRTIPVLALNLVGILTNRLRLTYKKLQLLSAKEVHERVAGHLIALAEKYGQQRTNGEVYISRRFTQSELADLVGASRVRVNQAIALFKSHCYISIDQHHCITIRDSVALNTIAGLCWYPFV
jgi:CRP/FNR family transcriptional regulator, cyclic AMP receptor protein